ncbi:MAG: CoB--CoM heterodisulfide reductase iron-sulfur subunit A family protein [Candidatus Bathyarchaeota archaeon]|nr:CoB--CoM heterodisulfide reductase iron-sulfur subunit A family protein [Candidatus Bathyarchaeota archaeon]MDH5418832.1 CoB--CoM heterodisulfide reductase iron-sulfur subunit A family protein [Candidatus Bathyarchaeota archaeon]MDH5623543.1 CoB--CoM heterodisulfide reductase iron-sulfur subunit A family protein [Candidatus Bathyarchaeota archaeon]MDH5635090.1 CoB--CoM heterodisulfide reductase iron-sulfur subunit A family protein [Candidatus Bathyarchaeota archaeon]MDH5701514.1 CoB--CoM het
MEQPTVLVVGGGISGIQASLDLASRGFKVYIVEKSPSIGGRMAQLDKTFPTMDCSMCILAPKMIECSHHPNVQLLTYSEVKEVKGSAGNFTVKILRKPRFVDLEKCTGCGTCADNCPSEVPNEFDEGLGMRKAIYMPFPQAVPRAMTVDKDSCIECGLCEKVCEAEAVNLGQEPEEVELKVGAIIVAVGFDLFDPSQIPPYGYGRHKDVVTALELERLLCASGPTGGHLVRPSDGKIPKTIAFIQCVGSRDRRLGNAYCSSICCKYSVKDAVLIKEHVPEARVCIFYIDLRAFGRGFQEFVNRAKTEHGIRFIRSNPGEITYDPLSKDLSIWYEDTVTKKIENLKFDMVVLCPALIPRKDAKDLAKVLGIEIDQYGFFRPSSSISNPVDTTLPGIFACGYCLGPKTGDIPDSITQGSATASRAADIMVEGT